MKDNLKKNLAQLQHEISTAQKRIEFLRDEIEKTKIEITNANAYDSYGFKGLAKDAEEALKKHKIDLKETKKFLTEKENEAAQVNKKMEAAKKDHINPYAQDQQTAELIGMVVKYKNDEMTAKELADGYNKLDKNGKDYLIERLSRNEVTLDKFKTDLGELVAKQGKGFAAMIKNQNTYKEISNHVGLDKGQSKG